MSLRGVSVEKGGRIAVIDGADTYTVTAAQRQRGDAQTTETLRSVLESSRGKALALAAHYYIAPSGNEYVIVGELLKPDRMPEMTGERDR